MPEIQTMLKSTRKCLVPKSYLKSIWKSYISVEKATKSSNKIKMIFGLDRGPVRTQGD